jgi:hypothetical protein
MLYQWVKRLCVQSAVHCEGCSVPTASSYPMCMNCMIHCCTSGLLRSQMFLLGLRREVRNSLALEGATATPAGFVPPPAKEIQVR